MDKGKRSRSKKTHAFRTCLRSNGTELNVAFRRRLDLSVFPYILVSDIGDFDVQKDKNAEKVANEIKVVDSTLRCIQFTLFASVM